MKDEKDQTSEGLNQIFEIINAKGDTGELEEIVQQSDQTTSQEGKNQTT
ncbi:hypothetical protein [Neobacillus cucumis]|nr:hypothetical protein [Neobacillus cucumis]MBM7656464.1 hypothetical protein [Neobacillus cucumis]MED4229195.1 hypothetical protein [Neobacillus cucumis]